MTPYSHFSIMLRAVASLDTLLEYCTGTDEVTKEFRAKAEELKKKIAG